MTKAQLIEHLVKEHGWLADVEDREFTKAQLEEMHKDQEVEPEMLARHVTKHKHVVINREVRMMGVPA